MTNFVYRSLSVRIWPGPGGWGVLEGGATAVMPTYGFALGDILAAWPGLSALWQDLSTYDKLCLQHDKVCLHIRHIWPIVCIWQTLSTPWQSLLKQANFVMHLTNFVCITQINSVCHADDKVCHEVTHFFIPPTNIVCVLYTVYCVLCTV